MSARRFVCRLKMPIWVAGFMLALSAHAFTGKVVGISDGDTITVMRDRVQVRVRPVEIDAPEKSQAFGTKSKESL